MSSSVRQQHGLAHVPRRDGGQSAAISSLASASLLEVFAQIVALHRDDTAVMAEGRRWSYGELDRLSDGLAVRLRERAARRGDHVGIFMERSPEAIAAMLAILKAGCAYVPFDPAAPGQRLAGQAVAAGIRVLMVSSLDAAPAWFEGERIAVTSDAPAAGAGVPDPLDTHPLELAYIMYTSGSTNEAKGVCVTQRAVLDLIHGADYCRFRHGDVVYHGMSIAFDGATFEIWGALLSGACLVVAPPRISLSEICGLVKEHGISVLLLSTGVFNALGQEMLHELGSVRVMLAGGDVMSPLAAQEYLVPGARSLVNGYGPTEITTFSHCHVMETATDIGTAVPIGLPVYGTRAYVLDDGLAPVPPGMEGELYLAGTGLAWGYLGNSRLTAERFLPDPFAADGSRMYRTGDLVVEAPGRWLNYIGRADQQVKIRGFRVELGEIETCLCVQGGLQAACVIHFKNDAGTSLLHAYAVRGPSTLVSDADELVEGLRKILPEYMLPRCVVFLDELPLTINGKVDRRALEALARESLAKSGDADIPGQENSLESALLGILRQLIGTQSFTLADHFFDAGGDSLTAMRFCAAVGDEHGIDLPLSALFEAESMQEIVDHIRQLKEAAVESA